MFDNGINIICGIPTRVITIARGMAERRFLRRRLQQSEMTIRRREHSPFGMTWPSRKLSISNMEHSAATARLGSGGSQGISFAAGTLLQPFVSVIAGVLSPIPSCFFPPHLHACFPCPLCSPGPFALIYTFISSPSLCFISQFRLLTRTYEITYHSPLRTYFRFE